MKTSIDWLEGKRGEKNIVGMFRMNQYLCNCEKPMNMNEKRYFLHSEGNLVTLQWRRDCGDPFPSLLTPQLMSLSSFAKFMVM